MTILDFPRVTREVDGLDAVEYVNSFFKDKARDEKYLNQLKKRCDDHGIESLLIMCDGEGRLGDPDEKALGQACKNPRCTRLAELQKRALLRNAGGSGSGWGSPVHMINPPFTHR